MGIYNVDSSKIVLQRGNSSYIDAGIQENITILGARYEKTAKGNEFLAIDIADSKGNKLSHTEWPISTKAPFETLDETKKQNVISVMELQFRRLTQIAETVLDLPLDSLQLKTVDFEDLATQFCNLINGKTEGKLFRVKIVYDKKGFTSMANSPRYRFIESMNVLTNDSKIKEMPGDTFKRPPMKDKEVKVENVLDVTPTITKEESPF